MTRLRERRPGENRGGAEGLAGSSTGVDDSAAGCRGGIAAQLRRRRAASWRCEPLADGRRDPWPELPREHYWTDRELDARRSWSQRHRARLDAIFGVRDPWLVSGDWTDAEIDAFAAAAEHLQGHGLYGRWQIPDSVRVAWYRRRCRCGTGAG